MKPAISLVSMSLLLAANFATADIPPCPAPQPPRGEIPPEIFSISRYAEDDVFRYSILIDLKYSGYSLERVGLGYFSGDDMLLVTDVDSTRLETQAAVEVWIAKSISKDVSLSWTYAESKDSCPDSVTFLYSFPAD